MPFFCLNACINSSFLSFLQKVPVKWIKQKNHMRAMLMRSPNIMKSEWGSQKKGNNMAANQQASTKYLCLVSRKFWDQFVLLSTCKQIKIACILCHQCIFSILSCMHCCSCCVLSYLYLKCKLSLSYESPCI